MLSPPPHMHWRGAAARSSTITVVTTRLPASEVSPVPVWKRPRRPARPARADPGSCHVQRRARRSRAVSPPPPPRAWLPHTASSTWVTGGRACELRSPARDCDERLHPGRHAALRASRATGTGSATRARARRGPPEMRKRNSKPGDAGDTADVETRTGPRPNGFAPEGDRAARSAPAMSTGAGVPWGRCRRTTSGTHPRRAWRRKRLGRDCSRRRRARPPPGADA